MIPKLNHTVGFGIPDITSVKDARFFNTIYKEKVVTMHPTTLRMIYPKGMSFGEAIQVFLWSKVFGEGPKVFQPTQLDFEALENTDLNIGIEDYAQPFETMVINVPDNYADRRQSKSSFTGRVQLPKFAILHNVPQQMLMAAVYTNGNRSYMCRVGKVEGETIEDALKRISSEPTPSGAFINPDEEINFLVLKAAVNACLVMDEVGVKRLGPMHPAYVNKLEERIKRKANVEQNKIDLGLHPSMFGFAQHVKLFDSENHDGGNGNGETGSKKPCHWRRGHYRMQVHGPNNTLRKRLRIKAVMVNKKDFLGDLPDAKGSYEL